MVTPPAGALAAAPETTQEINKPIEPRALLRGSESTIRAMAFSPDGKTLASGADDGSVRLWDISTTGARANPRDGGARDGGARDGGARVAGGGERAIVPMPKDAGGNISGGAIVSLAFSPDGKSLLTAGDKGDVTIWDPATLRPRASTSITSLAAAHFSPDGRFILIARGELADHEEDLDHVQLLDATTLKKLHIIDVEFEYVFDAVFSPESGTDGGSSIAVSGGDSLTQTPASRGGPQRCAIEIWTLKPDGTSTKGKRFGADSPRPLRSPAFSGGGKLLAAAAGDWLVWSVPASQQLATLRAGAEASGGYEARVCAFSPDVRWIATGALDSTVQLWNIKDWQSTYTNKSDATAECNAIAFSPDGRRLAAARKDLVAVFVVPVR